MSENPDFHDAALIACLRDQYGLDVEQVEMLPLGADPNAAIYRAETSEAMAYFVKVKYGDFDDTSVRVLSFLREQGIKQIIAPIMTLTEQLWTTLDDFTVLVYPFVEGKNGFDVALSAHQWVELGAALKAIHAVNVPAEIREQLPEETYSAHWRDSVTVFLEWMDEQTFTDLTAAGLAAFLKGKRDVIKDLVWQAERLGIVLRRRQIPMVLCHSDIHAGNVLIDANNRLYLVDWDTPMLAPKERDLMFIGGGIGGVWNRLDEVELFYRDYDHPQLDQVALAYYRFDRIVQDIAVTCEELLTKEGGADREEMLRQLTDQFEPRNVVAIAYRTGLDLPPEFTHQ